MMAQFIEISSKYDKSIPEIQARLLFLSSVQDTMLRACWSD